MSENKPHLCTPDDAGACVCGCEWCEFSELCTGPEYELLCIEDEEHIGGKGPWIMCEAGAKIWKTYIEENERDHWRLRSIDAVGVA